MTCSRHYFITCNVFKEADLVTCWYHHHPCCLMNNLLFIQAALGPTKTSGFALD